MIKRYKNFLLPLLLLITLFSGCNIFEWTYSAEKSDNLELVLAEADSLLFQKSYDRALALYERALTIESNSSQALYGRIRCHLLIVTSGNPVYTAFPYFFSSYSGSTPFFPDSKLIINERKSAFQIAFGDTIRLTEQYNGTDKKIATNSAALYADCAFTAALYGALLLSGETQMELNQDCSINAPSSPTPTMASNYLPTLYAATNALTKAQALTTHFLQLAPEYKSTDSGWSHMATNIQIMLSNSRVVITNMEAHQ